MSNKMKVTNVVVIGGGVSGAFFVTGLMRKVKRACPIHITIVDKKPYFEYIGTGTLRAMVDPAHHSNMTHTEFTKNANEHKVDVLHGKKVTNIDSSSNSITLQDIVTEHISCLSFDYLYIAVGASYPKFPAIKPDFGSLDERRTQLQEVNKQIREAEHVVIIGGGSFGCEFLAELNEAYPHLPVTMVNTRPNMLDRGPKGAHDYFMRYVDRANSKRGEKEKINVILNDMVHLRTNTTNKGVQLPPNSVYFNCYGITPNTAGLANFGIPITSDGNIKVDMTFKVVGKSNIYAIGDCNDIQEEKMAATARVHAKLASKNLASIIQGKSTQIEYVPSTMKQVVSLGTKDGFMINGEAIGGSGRMFGWMKGKVENVMVNSIKQPDTFMSRMMY